MEKNDICFYHLVFDTTDDTVAFRKDVIKQYHEYENGDAALHKELKRGQMIQVTIATKENSDLIGFSTCSPEDNFCRKVANCKAVGRLESAIKAEESTKPAIPKQPAMHGLSASRISAGLNSLLEARRAARQIEVKK